MENGLRWECKFFDALSVYELYEIIKLRNEVFVVEQNCVFQDADDKDQQCYHLMGLVDEKLVAYARLVPAEVTYAYVSIGRVITSPAYRKMNAGKQLMAEAIKRCNALFGEQKMKIGAQLYLKMFYESFGFVQTGEAYDEDGIAHVHMIRDML